MSLALLQYVRCTRLADAYARAAAELSLASHTAWLELKREEPLADRAALDELNVLHTQLSDQVMKYRDLASRHLKAAVSE